MFDRDAVFKEIALALDVGYWLIDCAAESVFWPKGLGLDNVHKTYGWTPLAEVAEFYEEPERSRFLGYLHDLLQNPNRDRTIEVVARGPARTRVPLRMCGRAVRSEKDLYVFGVIEALPPPERDDRCFALSAILDGVFLSSEAGILVLDQTAHVKRTNRAAVVLLAPDLAADAPAGTCAAVEERLPAEMHAAIAEATARRAAASGRLLLADGRLASWRSNPYGPTPGGQRGCVVVVGPVAAPPAARPQRPSSGDPRFQVLEHVAHATVVVSASTAEIRFANRAARQKLRLADATRYRVRNLHEVSGALAVARLQPPEPRVDVLPVTLPMGARLGRLTGIDDDLLLAEYVFG